MRSPSRRFAGFSHRTKTRRRRPWIVDARRRGLGVHRILLPMQA
jgi:hypothetical protein